MRTQDLPLRHGFLLSFPSGPGFPAHQDRSKPIGPIDNQPQAATDHPAKPPAQIAPLG